MPCPVQPQVCCPVTHHSHSSQAQIPLPKKVELMCAVALTAFAAYKKFALFFVTFCAGALYQAAKLTCNVQQKKLETQRPACGQGFGELVSQVSLLPVEIVLATSYVAWTHLIHDPKGFVPFVGFFVGMGLTHRLYTYYQTKQLKTKTV